MLSPPAIAPDAAATEAGIFGTVTDVPTIPRLTTPTIATSFRDEFRPDERYILERTTAQHMRNTSHRVDVIIVPHRLRDRCAARAIPNTLPARSWHAVR